MLSCNSLSQQNINIQVPGNKRPIKPTYTQNIHRKYIHVDDTSFLSGIFRGYLVRYYFLQCVWLALFKPGKERGGEEEAKNTMQRQGLIVFINSIL